MMSRCVRVDGGHKIWSVGGWLREQQWMASRRLLNGEDAEVNGG
jgi:hypothetical protein